jgi:hypothetical protein
MTAIERLGSSMATVRVLAVIQSNQMPWVTGGKP